MGFHETIVNYFGSLPRGKFLKLHPLQKGKQFDPLSVSNVAKCEQVIEVIFSNFSLSKSIGNNTIKIMHTFCKKRV